jgi:putative transport protein
MTRLQRAGTELIPTGHIFLQLGDVVKVVGPEEGVKYAAQTLGNEVKQLESPELAGIFTGIVLGVLLGSIPWTIPGIPVPVKLGLAGGPLIVSLLLTRFGGRFHVNSYATMSGNLMMRELGIALFLASVGLSTGPFVLQALGDTSTYQWLLGAAVIATVPLVLVGWVAHRWGRKTYFEVCGLLAGASTDPPALAFATQMAGSDVPALSYATVYPLTMILRIVAAQAFIIFLMS